eukprot:1175811-Amorphochlora_amoeboformis.AAC.2
MGRGAPGAPNPYGPPMMPGGYPMMAPPYGAIPPYGMPPMMPGMGMYPQPIMTARVPRPTQPVRKTAKTAAPVAPGTISVFVGRIPKAVKDDDIKNILEQCGQVHKWTRVSGFGFCEYSKPEGASRALRILKDIKILDKELLVKVDEKDQLKLKAYQDSLIKPAEKNTKKSESFEKDIKEMEKKKDESALIIIKKLIAKLEKGEEGDDDKTDDKEGAKNDQKDVKK